MKRSHKIILSAGGTGGHIYPAIAIADGLRERLKDVKILFIGAKDRMEMQKIPQAGYAIIGLWISGLRGKNIRELLLFPFKIMHSLWKSHRILKKFRPDLVIGTGGYASGALLYMAAQKNIPILIQEQNAIPGLTNKKLSRYARVICTAYSDTKAYFPQEKVRCLGNPLRKGITHCVYNRKEACEKFSLDPEKPVILSLGGSQGAHTLNQAWLRGLKKIIRNDIQLVWQSGKNDFEELKKYRETQHESIHITDFIDDISAAYTAADLIVSRAGALALSELALAGKPCLLIPYPWSVGDHQYKNTQAIVNEKAALMIANDQVDKILVDKVLDLIKDTKAKNTLSKNLAALARPRATEEIIKEILNLLP
ncbi:undecaprenyldiphospho-muramoylpentapeptide beta-N-acetylglucosaminyltransferase [Bacteroidetes bacterium endosymbiont of Geopemphigus sp.]|uniref:undecaprenyldiphospho-muramoylpentapeptide beta-N-acetylglucosaminyltransferase n=1 Tax=Bacteroidetes bacterium endosymbiont of Geopemphigus sp. TaxID=2047937 RepID=UPI000CD2AAAD|nr:undecaprenyldiphospho-muramoylpentapeptide beta-N-acetylglucosaminyltransferase [Bacteroidetes bacterium endosymbiont of Geopemphigus sp.]